MSSPTRRSVQVTRHAAAARHGARARGPDRRTDRSYAKDATTSAAAGQATPGDRWTSRADRAEMRASLALLSTGRSKRGRPPPSVDRRGAPAASTPHGGTLMPAEAPTRLGESAAGSAAAQGHQAARCATNRPRQPQPTRAEATSAEARPPTRERLEVPTAARTRPRGIHRQPAHQRLARRSAASSRDDVASAPPSTPAAPALG